jgi:hypothetical protein
MRAKLTGNEDHNGLPCYEVRASTDRYLATEKEGKGDREGDRDERARKVSSFGKGSIRCMWKE